MSRNRLKLNILRVIIATMICAVLLPLCYISVSAAEEGSCGKDLTWSFSAGTLTISGKGEMTNFREPDMAPWYHLRDQIRRVVFPEGLTSVGSLAFFDCYNLTSVILPESLRRIEFYSFAKCKSLSMLKLGGNEYYIGKGAFSECSSLDAVRLPYALQTLGTQAFYRCESLTTVTIQSSVTEMGTSVFGYCKNLVSVEIKSRLKSLPDWTFYGCEALSSISFPDTVVSLENYALKDCGSLTTVYFDGDSEKTENIFKDIVNDIPEFENYGHISTGSPSNVNTSGKTSVNEDGTITQSNITVKQDNNITVVTQVDHTHPENSTSGGSYSAGVTVTLENKDGWNDASKAVAESLKQINELNNQSSLSNKVEVTVYMKEDSAPDSGFVQDMAGRNVEMTVVSSNGSSWQIDCSHISDDPEDNKDAGFGYSYELSEPEDSVRETLDADDCYGLTFDQMSSVNSEVLVQLPSSSASLSDAYLYQIQDDGSYKRLQAVMVDQNAVAHFYLAAVDDETKYLIGVGVKDMTVGADSNSGDKVELIIPDELSGYYGNPIQRVEEIEYVVTGIKSSLGVGFGQFTWLLIAVLGCTAVVVGGVMFIMNKRRLKKGDFDYSQYEISEEEEE